MNVSKQGTRRLSTMMMFAAVLLIAAVISIAAPHRAEAKVIDNGTIENLLPGDTKQLTARIADAKILWTSSNTRVCVVNNSGFVQVVGNGTAKVTATAANGGTDTFRWTFKVKTLQINQKSLYLVVRRTSSSLTLNISAARNSANWSSTNTGVATVSNKGVVTPKGPGQCTINVNWRGMSASCPVTVANATEQSLRKLNSPKNSANRGKVVLMGSCLMDRWESVYSAFGSTRVINNAVPESTFQNWIHWGVRLAGDYKPKALVVCLGIENLRNGSCRSGLQMAEQMQAVLGVIHKKTKKTKIFFCSLPLLPGRGLEWDMVAEYNEKMKAFCKANPKYMTYLKLAESLMSGNTPKASYFYGTHTWLSKSGYGVMKNVVVRKVKKAAKGK